MILDRIDKGITMITGALSDTQDILDMTSPCKPIACATIATGYTRKMKLIHNVESVGTKIAALYGTGKNAFTCEIDDARLFNKKLSQVPPLESIIEWLKDPEQKKGPQKRPNKYVHPGLNIPPTGDHEGTTKQIGGQNRP